MAPIKVELIPWDPTDEKQYQRMYEQRVACGWRIEEVPLWKEKQLKGVKFLYWIVLPQDVPEAKQLLSAHVEKYPLEKEPIVDTAKSVGEHSRTPSGKSFIPIGHTALELCPAEDERFSLPKSTIWVKSLYISWALQSGGLGRSAMAETEAIATSAPHNCTVAALDTMAEEFQLSEEHIREVFDQRGLARPAKMRSNQEWYLRQGYEIMPTEVPDIFEWRDEESGEVKQRVPIVWMKKQLV